MKQQHLTVLALLGILYFVLRPRPALAEEPLQTELITFEQEPERSLALEICFEDEFGNLICV